MSRISKVHWISHLPTVLILLFFLFFFSFRRTSQPCQHKRQQQHHHQQQQQQQKKYTPGFGLLFCPPPAELSIPVETTSRFIDGGASLPEWYNLHHRDVRVLRKNEKVGKSMCVFLRIIGPSKLAILRTLPLRHTGLFTLPLENPRFVRVGHFVACYAGTKKDPRHIDCEKRVMVFWWWFQTFFIFTPIWGRFPFWLIFVK